MRLAADAAGGDRRWLPSFALVTSLIAAVGLLVLLAGCMPDTASQSSTTSTIFTDAQVKAATAVLENEFLPALQSGDFAEVRPLLVEERKADAGRLVAQAAELLNQRGAAALQAEAVYGESARTSWPSPNGSENQLSAWLRKDQTHRLAAALKMKDEAVWYFGMELTPAGSWLVWPWERAG